MYSADKRSTLTHFLGLIVTFLGFSSVFADEATISQPIVELRYWGNLDYAYFTGSARWGAPSCPNAYYAQIPAGTANGKQLLAIALSAKLAGANVAFLGACTGDPMYFNVSYIIVK